MQVTKTQKITAQVSEIELREALTQLLFKAGFDTNKLPDIRVYVRAHGCPVPFASIKGEDPVLLVTQDVGYVADAGECKPLSQPIMAGTPWTAENAKRHVGFAIRNRDVKAEVFIISKLHYKDGVMHTFDHSEYAVPVPGTDPDNWEWKPCVIRPASVQPARAGTPWTVEEAKKHIGKAWRINNNVGLIGYDQNGQQWAQNSPVWGVWTDYQYALIDLNQPLHTWKWQPCVMP